MSDRQQPAAECEFHGRLEEGQKALTALGLLPYCLLAGGGLYALCILATGREPMGLLVAPWLAVQAGEAGGSIFSRLSHLDPGAMSGLLLVLVPVTFAVLTLLAFACLGAVFAAQDVWNRRRGTP